MRITSLATACAALVATSQSQAQAPAYPQTFILPSKHECEILDYPSRAASAGADGTTAIEYTVNSTGRITSSTLVRSAGRTAEHKMLDRKITAILGSCKRKASDEVVPGIYQLQYVWRVPPKSPSQ